MEEEMEEDMQGAQKCFSLAVVVREAVEDGMKEGVVVVVVEEPEIW